MLSVNIHLTGRPHRFKVKPVSPERNGTTLWLDISVEGEDGNVTVFFSTEQAHELGLALVAAWGKYHAEPDQSTSVENSVSADSP